MKEIGIVLFLGFVFSACWKWGESKWIRIFQVLQLYKQKVDSTFSKEEAAKYNYQYQEAKKARKARHKFSVFMVGIFAVFSYSFLGLTLAGLWCFLINWTVFWIMDFLLNIFMKEKIWKQGTTAFFDRFGFAWRFILLAVFIAGLVFLSGCNSPVIPDSSKGIELKSSDATTDDLVFLYRKSATDPEGGTLKFWIEKQTLRGMFVVNSEGDVFIQKNILDILQKYTGQKFELVIGVSDGENKSFAVDTFIVVKSPDGKHYLKRDIA